MSTNDYPDPESETLSVDAYEIPEKSLPKRLRNLGLLLLTTFFVDGWEGPDIPGHEHLCAFSMYEGATFHSPGHTLWFFSKVGKKVEVSPEKLADDVPYIMERFSRKSHKPVRVWKNVIMRGHSRPGNN